MNKIILRTLISVLALFFFFLLYLGNTEVIINTKLIEKELEINDN